MEKMILRSLYRTSLAKSCRFSAVINHNHHLRRHYSSRSLIGLPTSSASISPNRLPFDSRLPFSMGIGNTRCLSEGVSHMPAIKDHEIQNVFKDLMAASWGELSNS